MKLTKNLKKMAEIAEQISSGNLLVDITPQSGRDLLGNAFLRMKDNLLSMLKETTEAVNVLASASSQISSTTTQLAASATETAASISETTTTVEEVKQTSKHTTEKANQVSETVKNTDIISQEGEKSIAETINGMTKINEQMQIIAETIIKLSEQSRTIGEIVASVSDIAEQSNLLAVNASIEAAKAGEQGKGFSVVAMEIKNLAEQSKQATKQVKNILDEIQNSINNAVLSTEQGSKVVEVGIKKSEVAGESIKELATNIGESSNAALMILATSQQQSVGMDQVATAMENIKQASMQNVESIKQLEIAAVNIKDLGGKLKTQMEKYKI
jgi:methyl-accepting chemotaxis protein